MTMVMGLVKLMMIGTASGRILLFALDAPVSQQGAD